MTAEKYIAVEREGAVLILTPHADLGESHWLDVEGESGEIVRMLEDPSIRHVVIDLGHSDYVGSEALGWFVRLRKQVARRGGRVLLCHLSPHAREILGVTQLDKLLGIYPSRAEALAAIGEAPARA
jgi:anti-anti-sigma factor